MDLQTLIDNIEYYLLYRDNKFCRWYINQYNEQSWKNPYYEGSKQCVFDIENNVNVKEMARIAYNAGYAWGLGDEEEGETITKCPYDNDLLKEIWENSYGEGYCDS